MKHYKKFINILFLVIGFFLLAFFSGCSHKIKTSAVRVIDSKDSTVRAKQNSKAEELKEDEYYKKNFFRYEDYTYKNNIQTILLYKEGFELAPPLIELGSFEKLKLSFDDLSAEYKTYKFTFIHCDANWKPSEIMPSEYIDGFTDDYINTYSSSFNTLQKFYHYELTFPTENMRPIKSGNYILKVYENDDTEENLAFTRRFMIYEQNVEITGEVNRAVPIEDQNYKQQLDFSITYNNYKIPNPYSGLKVVISQNDRWDNALINLKPKYVKNNELDYHYTNGENTFNGGNEFRHFDIKSVQFISDRIKKISMDTAGYQLILMPDIRRSFTVYSSMHDINGKKLIKTDEAIKNTDLEGEYVYVHFTLPYYENVTDGNLYVFGALTDWHYKKEAIMKYNSTLGAYECTLFLKQGYYNYEYVLLKNDETVGDETFIEGNHYDTENDYTIYVYNMEQGTFFDKLICVKRLNSVRK
ncbi:MAG: DUF5103 domain-containing protein [Bacteroidetes bacterium]|nr:DUF5103 domain-containing protein [Bacteroidota bacterium]